MRKAALAALMLAAILPTPAPAEGADAYRSVCAACHGEDARGVPGFAPPLADIGLWERLGPRAPEYLVGVILSGLSGRIVSEGETYLGMAMPKQAHLTDNDVLAVSRYVIQELNGVEVEVGQETLDAFRAVPPSHADLLALRKVE